MPSKTLKTIYVTAEVHERLRRMAVKRQYAGEDTSMGDIVAELLDGPINSLERQAAEIAEDVAFYDQQVPRRLEHDPRTPAERGQDEFTAEVLDTQASDRP